LYFINSPISIDDTYLLTKLNDKVSRYTALHTYSCHSQLVSNQLSITVTVIFKKKL